MNAQEIYLFHQTPPELAKKLMTLIPLEEGDVVCEPFRGEGAFFNAIPDGHPRVWAEIQMGKDYKEIAEEYDWVITNPPFQLEESNKRINGFWMTLDYFTQRAKKGVAFLFNKKCLEALTPRRLQILEQRGWSVQKIVVCSVKKWAGRYYFLVLTKNSPTSFLYLRENY